MSHEMVGFNKKKEEIAYLRFSMGNPAALIVYDLLDAQEYNGGVSGIGNSLTVPYLKITSALKNYQILVDSVKVETINEFTKSQLEEIAEFLQQCVKTANEEKAVEVMFC